VPHNPYICGNFTKDNMQEITIDQKLRLELLWWLLTALLVALIMAPIYIYAVDFPFWNINIVYIVTFITVARYIFLLPTTLIATIQWFKVMLIFAVIPAIFLLIQEMNRFQVFLDYNEPEDLIGLLPIDTSNAMMSYVRSEMVLFSVGSVISLAILPFRMVRSVWRYRNTGKP
jgi:hypothetical protein